MQKSSRNIFVFAPVDDHSSAAITIASSYVTKDRAILAKILHPKISHVIAAEPSSVHRFGVALSLRHANSTVPELDHVDTLRYLTAATLIHSHAQNARSLSRSGAFVGRKPSRTNLAGFKSHAVVCHVNENLSAVPIHVKRHATH